MVLLLSLVINGGHDHKILVLCFYLNIGALAKGAKQNTLIKSIAPTYYFCKNGKK